MSENVETAVKETCQACGNDRSRMMDIVRAVQEKFGCVSNEALDLIAAEAKCHRVEVESVVSFYAFLSKQPKGKVVIRLCDDIIDEMKGSKRVAQALKDELGIGFGETTEDGVITLEHTPCIGMCDQAPAMLVNDELFTYLGPDQAREIVRRLREDTDPKKLVSRFGDGNNGHDLVKSMVHNNIRLPGEVIFGPSTNGDGLRKALAMSPQETIRDIKTSRLRGRGGAGFPTGMKWDFARSAPGAQRYVLCNADEGEPGTFKDRVLLTERADLLFEGMTIAGYAIGADTGILYLRAEYAYLRAFLEDVLNQRREDGFLGKNVCGKDGFHFDIRIQMGAGAYVCGEETALISSCEGLRGDPKNRPPFPAQKGYMGCPTTVNNVETLCCVTRILEEGPGWFAQFGTKDSPGTKLLSISGDCHRPGIYELPYGMSLLSVLKLAGADDAIAVQVGGPSGTMVPPDQFDRVITYEDLATGGSMMVFGQQRNVLQVVSKFLDFFIEESCGYCTPCRAGNVLLKERLDRIIDGKGEPADLDYLQELGETVKIASRCGLGQTSPNPVLTTLKSFRSVYEGLVQEAVDGRRPSFDIQAALADATAIAGHSSEIFKD
ncbi:NAD(P)H-dependent oxidoreductase subunit E [Planctomycetota bacterium]